jgi:hypothetical protein
MTIKPNSRIIDINAEVPICVLHETDARKIDAGYLSRIEINLGKKKETCILDTSLTIVKEGTIGFFKNTADELKIKEGEVITINLLPQVKSVNYIINKIKNKTLSKDEIYEIVKDIEDNKITEVELSSFVTSCYLNGLNIEESTYLCNALVDAGDLLDYNKKEILNPYNYFTWLFHA